MPSTPVKVPAPAAFGVHRCRLDRRRFRRVA